jgi:hypothetical protein
MDSPGWDPRRDGGNVERHCRHGALGGYAIEVLFNRLSASIVLRKLLQAEEVALVANVRCVA